jgi:hypothetical protein
MQILILHREILKEAFPSSPTYAVPEFEESSLIYRTEYRPVRYCTNSQDCTGI